MPGEAKVSHSLRDGCLVKVHAGTFSAEIRRKQFVVLSGRHATQDSGKARGGYLSLTPAEKRSAQQIFAEGKACPDCGGIHHRACPRIRRQVWLRTGAGAGERTEVEYWPEYDQTGIIWPEDAFDPENAEVADGR